MTDVAKSTDLDVVGGEPIGLLPVGGGIKRGFDIVAALLAIVLLSPLFILIAALVKFSDGGSIFYGHCRIGCGGRVFRCYKFRTMAEDGDAILAEYLRSNADAWAEWRATRKLKNDPRITRVGLVLRKLSLDELPQIVNILLGDMSLVGPRPVVSDELEIYGKSAIFYLKTRPGLTGLWQISGRNDVGYGKRIAYDRYYVQNWSLAGDLRIIAKTVPAVCMARGSY